jgi:hypothetical protein
MTRNLTLARNDERWLFAPGPQRIPLPCMPLAANVGRTLKGSLLKCFSTAEVDIVIHCASYHAENTRTCVSKDMRQRFQVSTCPNEDPGSC